MAFKISLRLSDLKASCCGEGQAALSAKGHPKEMDWALSCCWLEHGFLYYKELTTGAGAGSMRAELPGRQRCKEMWRMERNSGWCRGGRRAWWNWKQAVRIMWRDMMTEKPGYVYMASWETALAKGHDFRLYRCLRVLIKPQVGPLKALQ